MPVIPNLVERMYMLRLNRGPGPMLDLFGGMSLEVAMLGLDLGVFAALDDDPAMVGELADRLDVDETGLRTLLGFLTRAGYVTRRGGRYSTTAMSEKWMLESSETSYARYFRFWRRVLYPFWREHGEEAIRNGEPPITVYEWLDDHPDCWPVAQDAFQLTAELIGDDIAGRLDVPEGGSVLDLGGGHALYSIALCDRYPTVSATVFDTAAVVDIAAGNIAAASLSDRIRFEAGDYESDGIPERHDLVLVFNIVHGHNPETNRELFRKLGDSVVDGGTIAILDQFGDESRAAIANTGTRFLDLTYFASLGGRTYHSETVRSWLEEAGFRTVNRHEFTERNMTLLIAERA
jgi:SAM-dependent methyltransferase